MVILVDSGASHKLISKEIICDQHLSTDPQLQFQVMLGDEKTTPGPGICYGVPFSI